MKMEENTSTVVKDPAFSHLLINGLTYIQLNNNLWYDV